MSEGRDRLIREERILTSGFGGGGIRFDSPPPIGLFNAGRGGVGRFFLFGSPRLMKSDVMGVRRSPVVVARQRRLGHGGQENSRLRRRETSRSNNFVLPSWYPRRPLQDVATVVRAIERRRARLADTKHHRLASPTPEELGVPVPDLSTVDAPLEHGNSLTTPSPTIIAKTFCPKVLQNLPKTRLDNLISEEVGFITPQKRLLNSIDQVEKVMLEELQRIKRTPSAKKAEREESSHFDVNAVMETFSFFGQIELGTVRCRCHKRDYNSENKHKEMEK